MDMGDDLEADEMHLHTTHLPPIDYARPRHQQSPISTLHLANLRRPLPDLEVHVSDNIRKI